MQRQVQSQVRFPVRKRLCKTREAKSSAHQRVRILLRKTRRSVMDEKLYKKVKGIGASNLAFGIITLVFGITAGVMLIVNGARLLAHKSDSLI